MSRYYFAYGSNMNPQRMRDRNMQVRRALSGRITGLSLAFNKRAAEAPWRSYANVVYAPRGSVEGVLYELVNEREMAKMDAFESAPRFYSREIYRVATAEGEIAAWVYVANRAMIEENLLPERWYVAHLLAGQPWLSEDYYASLSRIPCRAVKELECPA